MIRDAVDSIETEVQTAMSEMDTSGERSDIKIDMVSSGEDFCDGGT